MAMLDFGAHLGEAVRRARDVRRQQAGALRPEGEGAARHSKEMHEQASEPVATTWGRIRTAARASDGALVVDRSDHQRVTVFELGWHEDQPSRSLQITVDRTDGMIQATWIVAPLNGRSVDTPSVGATGFEISKIESAILLLVDQPRWAHGAISPMPW
jgi:hypothetical protein